MDNSRSNKKLEFKDLQRRLRAAGNLANFNYRGERTYVVISGMNSDILNLRKVVGLPYYEERMLFFLFLLRYKKTRIIYVTSSGFNTKLFDYYLKLISGDPTKIKEMKTRLTHISVDNKRTISLTRKVLDNQRAITKIKKALGDSRKGMLRCYNPGDLERRLAVKIGIPIFGGAEKFDFVGTKSGSRKIFKLAGLDYIPGWIYLKNFTELSIAMAKLLKDHPYYKKLMVKLDYSSSGRGNAVFKAKEFLKENEIEISIKTDINKIARLIRKNFCKYVSFQMKGQDCQDYISEFNLNGGIVELYISAENKYSPSVQMCLNPDGQPKIISTHEQILGGPDDQKYVGCIFPARTSHRKSIVKEAKKVGNWMARHNMIGNFGVDFVVVYSQLDPTKCKIYPIEINLRKGGTTHPFRIVYFLTGAKYNNKEGMLYCGKKPIYYLARDIIESKDYKNIKAMDLIDLVLKSRINFNKNTKKGVLVFMPGTIRKYGKFGAVCIGNSRREAENYYKRLIKLVDNYAIRK